MSFRDEIKMLLNTESGRLMSVRVASSPSRRHRQSSRSLASRLSAAAAADLSDDDNTDVDDDDSTSSVSQKRKHISPEEWHQRVTRAKVSRR
jgi:RNA processing factor Prp31